MSTFFGISSDSVSTLFSSLGTSSNSRTGSTSSSILADYAAIKNGSYYKLVKSYYAEVDAKEGVSSKTDTAKELTRMKEHSDDLSEAADVLLDKSSKSLFKEEPESRDEVLKAVNAFVEAYNTTVEDSEDANETAILTAASSMVKTAQANSGLLASVGINIDGKNHMSVDEEIFNKAEWTDIKSLFHGNGSFAYAIKTKASYLSISAKNAASNIKTYNANGYQTDFDYSSVLDDKI